MPSKLAKYGIRLFDMLMLKPYTCTMLEKYCSKEGADATPTKDPRGTVVRQHVQPLQREGHNIITDCFPCIQLETI